MSAPGAVGHRSAVVVGTSSPIARAVQAELAGHGWDVAAVGGPGEPLLSRAAATAAFDRATGTGPGGPPELVVHADVPAAASSPAEVVDLDGAGWDDACEAVIRSTLVVFHAAHRAMAGRGGALVLVSPTIALVGASGLVPWSAAAESQRVMAKVAARRWGAAGIRVNVVSVPPALLCDDPAPVVLAAGRTKAGAALVAEDPAADAAALVRLAADPGARALTGATLVADGGRIMVP